MILAASTDLARGQTAFSLAFHICFAVFGVGMPWLLLYTERRWIRRATRSGSPSPASGHGPSP